MHLADQEKRPPFHFIVNASNIFAEDADADQLHAAEKQDRNNGGRVAIDHGDAEEPDVENAADHEEHAVEHREASNRQTERQT